MAENFENRVVIITGGAGGVGHIVSLRWLQTGARVLIVDRGRSPLDQFTTEYAALEGAEPSRLATVTADLTTPEGAATAVADAGRVFSQQADTLIHLVGAFAMEPLDANDGPTTWRRLMSLNLDSAFYCYRAMLPALRARNGGWIVGLGSRAALAPPAQMAAYAASKAGLIALTQSLSQEVKAEQIHVNVILASSIDTPATHAAGGDEVKDWVTGNDIAEATLYLCSERARAVHGATLEVYANA